MVVCPGRDRPSTDRVFIVQPRRRVGAPAIAVRPCLALIPHRLCREILHEICRPIDLPPEGRATSVMRVMTNASTNRRSAAALANQSPGRLTPRATRYECQHCHTNTFLVLRTISEAKCSVCDSFDLMPVQD